MMMMWNFELQGDMDRFVDDGSLEDNVESFLSQEDADPRDRVTRCSDVGKGTPHIHFHSYIIHTSTRFSFII